MIDRPPARPPFHALAASFEESEPGFYRATVVSPGSYPTANHARQGQLQETSFWYRHRRACIQDSLERFPVASLLDVGGSEGHLTEALGMGRHAALLEPDPQAARAAWKRGLRPVFNGSLTDAGLPDGSVDAVGLFDVLEHIEADRAFLREIARVLRPGGRLFLTVPAMPWLWSDFDRSVGHFRRYRARALEAMLDEVGLRVRNRTHLFALLPLPVLAARRLRPSFGARVGASTRRDHVSTRRPLGRVLQALLALERRAIRGGWRLPLGTSFLCVAEKPRP